MPVIDYACGECGYRFRTPAEAPKDRRSLMCPSCGSIDINIVTTSPAASRVMRAKVPVAAGEERPGDSGTS